MPKYLHLLKIERGIKNHRLNNQLRRNLEPEFTLLNELIATSYPRIKEDILDWEKVEILRQWIYETIPWGTSSVQLNQTQYQCLFNSTAFQAISMFLQNQGATMCQGAAYTLMRLYHAYKFQSYLLGIGLPEANHALTLVEITHKYQKLLTVQDPTYNTTYIKPNYAPRDYFDMIRLIKIHKENEVIAQQGENLFSNFIITPEEATDPEYSELANHSSPILLPNGNLNYKLQRPKSTFVVTALSQHQVQVIQALERAGNPPNSIYLFLHLLYIRNHHFKSVQDLTSKATKILTREIK